MIETMIETKHIIAELSVTEKICLYNALYEDLAGKGIEGDTELAHVNKEEMVVLRDMGGSGTINPNTGLIQFGGGSPPPPPAAPTNTTQTSEFPTELRPFIKDVLGKAQAIQEQRETEGYVPFQGPQIASFTPEQEQAFTGIQGLVGQGQGYFDPSTELAKSSAVAPTSEAVQAAMSPYTQNVVDIQQREALRQADVAQQQLGAQAVSAGGYGGSRMAILEAEQNRNTQQLLGDIQARGQAAAFEDAQTRLAQQSGRELAASGQLMNLGSVAPQQALKELTSIEAIGAQKQAQGQRALDITKQQFQEEQLFPEQTLQQYQSVIRGFPLAPTTYTNTQTTIPAPSYLQQAAGLGATAVGLAGAFGGFGGGRAKGGLVSRMSGGQVDQNSGLGSIVVKKNVGGSFKQAMNEAAAQSAIESNYNKELFQKVLNNEITPGEYARLVRKYKDSAMAEMPEETDIDPEFLASRTIPKGRGTAMSPVEARIAAQERRMGLSMADQPITPSLSTEEIASRMRQSGNLDKREKSIIDSANLRKGAEKYDVGVGVSPSRDIEDLINRIQKRQAGDKEFQKSVSLDDLRKQIQAGMGGADAPVTPLTSDMLESGERSRDKARANQLANISNILASRKDMEDGVGEYGRGFGIEQEPVLPQSFGGPQLKRTSPNYLTDRRKPGQPLVGDTTFLDRLYNAIPNMPEAKAKLQELRRQEQPIIDDSEEEKVLSLPQTSIGGDKQPIISSGENLPSSVTLDLTQPSSSKPSSAPAVASTAAPEAQKDIIIDQDKGAGLGNTRTIAGLTQQADYILKNKPSAEKTLTSFGKEISDLRKTLDERSEKKRTTAQRRKDSIKSDKFLAVAQMGLNILAQDGGQTFLQAIGKGSKNVIPTLMKLSREELKLAENLDDLDFETAKAKFGLTEAEFNRYVKQRKLDIAEREVEIKGLTAQGKMGKEGAPLSMAMLQSYARSITGLPQQALQDNKFLTDLANESREDAIKSLRESGRGSLVGDTGTIQSEQVRQIQQNPEKYIRLYGKNLPSKMGKGAPPLPRINSTDTMTSIQERLRNSRTPQ